MPHPLVLQLRFTRSELLRALKDVSAEEAVKHFEPMNCISWIVGHLANQEQTYWLTRAQGITPVPEVTAYGFGQPKSTPDLDEMWAAWHQVTDASNDFLDTLDNEQMTSNVFPKTNVTLRESVGTSMYRVIYHYWFHLGESQAIRQLLGHTDLPSFVGNLGGEAPYTPE